MLNPKMFENMQNVEFMMKCTFCPAEADGDLTVEVEADTFVPMPICEACLTEQAKNFNIIKGPVQ